MDHDLPDKSSVGCLFSAIVIIVVSIAGITFARDRFGEFVCNIPVLRFCDEKPSSEPGLPTIDEIRAMGQWETLEVDFSTVVKVTNRRGTWPLQADEVLIYNVCGRTTAGIDLAKLENQDVKINKNAGDAITHTITITLPRAEVFAVNPADGTFNINSALNVPTKPNYSFEEDVEAEVVLACNKDIKWDVPPGFDKTPSLIQDAEKQAMIQFRSVAEEGYILGLAQQNAKRELKQFLKLAGYENVIVVEPTQPNDESREMFPSLDQYTRPEQDVSDE